jgi:ankyrin repeat protein
MLAVENGHAKIAQLLLDAGAEKDAKDKVNACGKVRFT